MDDVDAQFGCLVAIFVVIILGVTFSTIDSCSNQQTEPTKLEGTRTECPHCYNVARVDYDLVHKEIYCPNCNEVFEVERFYGTSRKKVKPKSQPPVTPPKPQPVAKPTPAPKPVPKLIEGVVLRMIPGPHDVTTIVFDDKTQYDLILGDHKIYIGEWNQLRVDGNIVHEVYLGEGTVQGMMRR